MKYLRTLSIAAFLSFALFLNWNCSDDSNYNVNTSNNEVLTDDPSEHVTLVVLEYCLISPPLTAPYYAYLTVCTLDIQNFLHMAIIPAASQPLIASGLIVKGLFTGLSTLKL